MLGGSSVRSPKPPSAGRPDGISVTDADSVFYEGLLCRTSSFFLIGRKNQYQRVHRIVHQIPGDPLSHVSKGDTDISAGTSQSPAPLALLIYFFIFNID